MATNTLDWLETDALRLAAQMAALKSYKQKLKDMSAKLAVRITEHSERGAFRVDVEPAQLELEGILARRIHTGLIALTTSAWKLVQDETNIPIEFSELDQQSDLSTLRTSASQRIRQALGSTQSGHELKELATIIKGTDPILVPKANLECRIDSDEVDRASGTATQSSLESNIVRLDLEGRRAPITLNVGWGSIIEFSLYQDEREITGDIISFLQDTCSISTAVFAAASEICGYPEYAAIEPLQGC